MLLIGNTANRKEKIVRSAKMIEQKQMVCNNNDHAYETESMDFVIMMRVFYDRIPVIVPTGSFNAKYVFYGGVPWEASQNMDSKRFKENLFAIRVHKLLHFDTNKVLNNYRAAQLEKRKADGG